MDGCEDVLKLRTRLPLYINKEREAISFILTSILGAQEERLVIILFHETRCYLILYRALGLPGVSLKSHH
jgi:hypothetical protein